MHAVILSPPCADPNRRGKLHALAGLGCTLTVAIPGGEASVDRGVRVAPIPVRGPRAEPDRLRWSRRALTALLRDHRPDILQIEAEPTTQAALVAVEAAHRLGVPTVAFSWESLPRTHRWLARRRRRTVLALAAGVIGGNRLAEALLRAEAPHAARAVIPQFGVDLPALTDRPARDALAIGYIGRLLPERGVDLLLRGVSQVMGPWSLRILGTGPEQEALEDLSQRLGLASRVQWLGGGGRAEIERVWQEADVLVVPSRATPGWVDHYHPILVEAMARGLAPVVTDTGALPEIVGDAGLVVNDVDALGLALQRLLAEPGLRRDLGQAARRRVLATCSDSAVAGQTLAFWRVVLGAGPSAPPTAAS